MTGLSGVSGVAFESPFCRVHTAVGWHTHSLSEENPGKRLCACSYFTYSLIILQEMCIWLRFLTSLLWWGTLQSNLGWGSRLVMPELPLERLPTDYPGRSLLDSFYKLVDDAEDHRSLSSFSDELATAVLSVLHNLSSSCTSWFNPEMHLDSGDSPSCSCTGKDCSGSRCCFAQRNA